MSAFFIRSLLFVVLLGSRVTSQDSLRNVAFTGVTLIDAHHQQGLPNQTLLITDNVISDIFPDRGRPIPDSFALMRMAGKYLLPGLIDAHVHLATDPSGTDDRAHILGTLRRMLYSGVTSVRDMAGDARTLAGLSRDAQAGDIPSPDIYYSALMAGPAFFSDPRTSTSTKGAQAGNMPYMLAVTDSTNLTLAIAEARGSGATGIKLYANLEASLVKKIVTEAGRQHILVWGHAWLQSAKPSDLVGAGVQVISHAPLLLHEQFDTVPVGWKRQPHDRRFWDSATPDLSALYKMMKDHHTLLDATLLTYRQWSSEDSAVLYSYETGKRMTAQAYKAGVMIDAGTDDDQKALVNKEIELLVKEAGLTAIDAIIAATFNGAKALGIDQSKGTIAKGKVADMVVLDKNPLEDIENIEAVFIVVKDGKIYRSK